MRRVGGGYQFLHRPLLDHFAKMNLPPPKANEIHHQDRARAASSGSVSVAMGALAVIGVVTLFLSLEANVATAVIGTVLLASVALWLVFRSAVASALRAERPGEDDE